MERQHPALYRPHRTRRLQVVKEKARKIAAVPYAFLAVVPCVFPQGIRARIIYIMYRRQKYIFF